MAPRHRNWADLPIALLGFILEKVVLLPDYIRFSVVCKGWRSAALDNYLDRLKTCHQQPPMLLLSPVVGDDNYRRLYSIWEGKTYLHPFNIPCTKRVCGSSYGWLALTDRTDLSITLLRLFSGKAIQLPNIRRAGVKSDSEFRVCRVALSCDPCLNPNNWVAVAVYGPKERLAFMRAGHSSWYYVIDPIKSVNRTGFHEGQLYVMNRRDELFQIAVQEVDYLQGDGWSVRVRLIKTVEQLEDAKNYTTASYFVELKGDLLLVCKRHGSGNKMSVNFCVFKLYHKEKQPSGDDSHNVAEWIEIHDLGGFSLFLGENKPICIYAANSPDCKPNCIYYTSINGNFKNMVEEVCVFDLPTGHIHHCDTIPPSWRATMPCALWISPTLG